MLGGRAKGCIRIGDIKKGPIIEREGKFYPLPFGQEVSLEGKWFLSFKFTSTCGGGAEWRIHSSYKKEQFLSTGRYCPVWKGIVENPTIIWYTEGNFLFSPSKEGEAFPLWQKFSRRYAWEMAASETREYTVNTKSAESLPMKRILSKIPFHNGESEPIRKQGHLEIWEVKEEVKKEIEKEINNGEEFFPTFRKKILNHCVLEGRFVAVNRRSNNNSEGDFCDRNSLSKKGGVIVSSDHLWNPLQIEEGIYLVTHPLPEGVID